MILFIVKKNKIGRTALLLKGGNGWKGERLKNQETRYKRHKLKEQRQGKEKGHKQERREGTNSYINC